MTSQRLEKEFGKQEVYGTLADKDFASRIVNLREREMSAGSAPLPAPRNGIRTRP
jgi:hypothetical protein